MLGIDYILFLEKISILMMVIPDIFILGFSIFDGIIKIPLSLIFLIFDSIFKIFTFLFINNENVNNADSNNLNKPSVNNIRNNIINEVNVISQQKPVISRKSVEDELNKIKNSSSKEVLKAKNLVEHHKHYDRYEKEIKMSEEILEKLVHSLKNNELINLTDEERAYISVIFEKRR